MSRSKLPADPRSHMPMWAARPEAGAVRWWLEIRASQIARAHGGRSCEFAGFLYTLMADMDHSNLLDRILSGEKPHEESECSHGYRWDENCPGCAEELGAKR
jgi:hypothetical protein